MNKWKRYVLCVFFFAMCWKGVYGDVRFSAGGELGLGHVAPYVDILVQDEKDSYWIDGSFSLNSRLSWFFGEYSAVFLNFEFQRIGWNWQYSSYSGENTYLIPNFTSGLKLGVFKVKKAKIGLGADGGYGFPFVWYSGDNLKNNSEFIRKQPSHSWGFSYFLYAEVGEKFLVHLRHREFVIHSKMGSDFLFHHSFETISLLLEYYIW